MNTFFNWTFNVHRSSGDRPKMDAEDLSAAVKEGPPATGSGRTGPAEQAKDEEAPSFIRQAAARTSGAAEIRPFPGNGGKPRAEQAEDEIPAPARPRGTAASGASGPRRTERRGNDEESSPFRTAAANEAGRREPLPVSTGGGAELPGASRTASDIGAIADCARKQVRFLRRMNDLLKSRADGAYYL
ncbi:MAG: hypothetical protein IJU70_12545 [Lentisphaeria bacterium]|nr:hypothetical protein [Lentisphaeria bacterium]